MNLLVLMKAVVSTTGGIAGAEKTSAELMPNPADITALEEALKLKDSLGYSVTVVSMGPQAVSSMLRDALARGADSAVLLSDADFAGADTAATSRTLAAAIEKLGSYGLILCGRKTTDGETGQVGPELAERLGLECVTNCCGLSLREDELFCECLLDGAVGKCVGKLPLLVSVVYGINSPRLPSLSGLRRAKREEVICLDREALDIPKTKCGHSGSPTKVLSTYSTPFEKRKPIFVDSSELSTLLAQKTAAGCGKEALRG